MNAKNIFFSAETANSAFVLPKNQWISVWMPEWIYLQINI